MNTPIKKVLTGAVVIAAFMIYLVFTNKDSASVIPTDNGAVVSNAPTTTPTGNTSTGISGDLGTIVKRWFDDDEGEGEHRVVGGGTGSTGNTGATGSAGSTGGTTTGGTTTGGTATAGKYKNGTYTGSVVDAFYGNMQVAAVIQGGKLVDVQFLQYPSDQGTSREINSQSNPMLKQEAISAQSANVNIVSGATQSSEAFRQSLASALSQATI